MKFTKILTLFDSLIVLGLCIMLIVAFGYQLTVHDLPCSMCVMSRMGIYAIAFGLVINLCRERRQSNYMIVIIAAMVQIAISLEFLVRHIVPGSGTYGSAVFGLHMYTWNFITTFLIIVYSCIAGLLTPANGTKCTSNFLIKIIIGILMLTLLANTVSTFIECGPYSCPSDPTSYWLFN